MILESSAARVSGAIVSVGNELLFGETVDTNASWLATRLTAMGVPVLRGFTVPDQVEAIKDGVASALRVADLIVVTGGLGPTNDDLTREAVAELLDRPLLLDREHLESLTERFRKRGFDSLPESNISQAQVPEGADLLTNPLGTAPGLALHVEGATVALLPGVPREMKAIFEADFSEMVMDRFGERLSSLSHRLIHTTGVPESRVAEIIEKAIPQNVAELGPGVALAYLPDVRGVDLRLTAAGTADEAKEALDRAEALLAPLVAQWRFEADSGDLSEAVLNALRESGETLAVAESCTAGMIAARLTEHAGASDVFLGGVVAYANQIKESQLGVPASLLSEQGAVSEAVAIEMAKGVRIATQAGIGLSITGVAGPDGGTDEKPVGTVWMAVSGAQGTVAEKVFFAGDRAAIRERAGQSGLALVLRTMGGLGVTP